MKKLLSLLSILAFVLSTAAFAASGGKEITIDGNACCAKCQLKEADTCQSVISVEKDGKKSVYYLADNAVAQAFHEKICKGAKPATATGVCVKVGDKLQFTATKADVK